MIASLLAQAIRSVFRFSPMEGNASAALRRSPHDYDLVRRFLASGLVVANTFYGPVKSSFTPWKKTQCETLGEV